jgi:hypothetical protein
MILLGNISNPTMSTGHCADLKSSPVRIGGFEITSSHTNKSLLNKFESSQSKDWINFDQS